MKSRVCILKIMICTILVIFGNNIPIMAAQKYKSISFIDTIKNSAIEQYKKYNILPSLTIAQAMLESANGKSGLCLKANNLFGIKTKKGWTGKTFSWLTSEYINNRKVYVTCKFRAYDSIEDSIEDHSKFLLSSRYYLVRKAKDYKKACLAIQKCGYATSPTYAYKLIALIEKNKLQKYDEIAKHMKC